MTLRAFQVFGLVMLVLLVLGVLWAASEIHYTGCVKAAEARTPVVADPNPPGWRNPSISDLETDRATAVAGCSRLP